MNETGSRLNRSKKGKSKKRILKWLFIALAIIIVGVTAFTGYASWKLNNAMNKASDSDNKDTNQNQTVIPIEDQTFAMVLLGEDYRPETRSKNTDAIIVAIWNPETKDITLLSVPRDTKVNIPGYGEGKINSAYVKGEIERKHLEGKGETSPSISGPHMVMNVLSDLLKIPVKYYAIVDFQGFEMMIDQLDGININVDRDMYYVSPSDGTDINLKKGIQHLTGKEALDYARFRRSSDGHDSSDFQRNDRHQQILKAIADKLMTFKGVTNIFNILDIASDHVTTNLTPDDMKGLFWKYKGVSDSNFKSIKMESNWQSPYVLIDDDELIRVQNELHATYYANTNTTSTKK